MDMTVEHVQGPVPVAILTLHGNLNASNYEELIERANTLYAAGTRAMVLDLSDVPLVSSAGLIALHSIVLLLQGRTPPNPEYGWQTLYDLEHDIGVGMQTYVKLLNPRPVVVETLEMTGLKDFFQIYTTHQEAIGSFV